MGGGSFIVTEHGDCSGASLWFEQWEVTLFAIWEEEVAERLETGKDVATRVYRKSNLVYEGGSKQQTKRPGKCSRHIKT
jgi:hypothetical protein